MYDCKICPHFFPGIVLIVRYAIEVVESLISILAVEQGLKLAVDLDTAILAHAEEDDPVDGALDGKIEIADAEFRSAGSDSVPGHRASPRSRPGTPRLPEKCLFSFSPTRRTYRRSHGELHPWKIPL